MTLKGNGLGGLLSTLASSGDKGIQLVILGLIAFTGGGNWWETRVGNELNAKEIERAIQEIHDLYPKLNEAIGNQREMLRDIEALKERHQ